MIQPLRKLHRLSFLMLTLAVPTVFLAGLLVRPVPPSAPNDAHLVALSGTDWRKHAFAVQYHASPGGVTSISLIPTKIILAPDLLVYYTNQPPEQGMLPSDAHLLGQWEAGRVYPLPDRRSGFAVLYSNAQKSVLDFVPLAGTI